MQIIINIFIFIIVLFVYIHIYHHVKTSNFLEIEIYDNLSKESFEELCDSKQPFIMNTQYLPNIINNITFETVITELPSLTQSQDISINDYSDSNSDLIEDTRIESYLNNNDVYLKPYGIINNKSYDLITGSRNSYSKLKTVYDSRNIYYINSGSAEVTLISPKNQKYLYIEHSEDNEERISAIDVYNVDDKYKSDLKLIKRLTVILRKGELIQIPSSWFYSIKILDNNTLITNYRYRTFMNYLAIIFTIAPRFIQNNMEKYIKLIISYFIVYDKERQDKKKI